LIMYKSYIKPYVDELINYFEKDESNLLKNNTDICQDINSHYSGKDVLFLTQSNGRYLSSWLNIMRDDFGCISFLSRSSNRNLKYNLSDLNDEALKDKINRFTDAKQYLDRFEDLVNE
jgi:hypothetical protein